MAGARLRPLRFGNALRPFVYGEKTADAVAGAMGVIEPRRLQELARQHVELRAAGAGRKHRTRQRNVPL